MPRDVMRGRSALEFDEVFACLELDREEAGGSGETAATSDDSEENIPAFFDPTA